MFLMHQRGTTAIKKTSNENTNTEESEPNSSLRCKWDNYQGYSFKKNLSLAHKINCILDKKHIFVPPGQVGKQLIEKIQDQ